MILPIRFEIKQFSSHNLYANFLLIPKMTAISCTEQVVDPSGCTADVSWATIIKRKKKYSVVYYYEDEKGEKKQKWETYNTPAEDVLLSFDSMGNVQPKLLIFLLYVPFAAL